MGKGLGFLWWQAAAVEDLFCGLKLGDQGEDFDFGPPALPVPRCWLLGMFSPTLSAAKNQKATPRSIECVCLMATAFCCVATAYTTWSKTKKSRRS